MEQMIKYKCPKCGGSQFSIGENFGSGSLITRVFGFQNRRFTTVTCQMCHFTEFYQVPRKQIAETLNFLAR